MSEARKVILVIEDRELMSKLHAGEFHTVDCKLIERGPTFDPDVLIVRKPLAK